MPDGTRPPATRPPRAAGLRWGVPAACVLAHVVAIRPGPPIDVSATAQVAAAVLGAAAGLTTALRLSRPRQVALAVTALYAGQLLLAGAVLPVAPAVAYYGLSRRVAVPQGPGMAVGLTGLLGAVLVGRGVGDVAISYLAVLLLVTLAGLARAADVAREAAARDSAVAAERMRIARDLHDVVGHGMSAITVSAGSARLALQSGLTDEASRALSGIEAAGRDVLRNVRWLVGLLRENPDGAGLAALPALVDGMRRAGLPAELVTRGNLPLVEPDVGEAAYRIVQEALTNALRHAGASAVRVSVAAGPDLDVEVSDDGTGAARGWVPGSGLPGMAERAAAVGGRLDVGPLLDRIGWRVHLRVPLPGERP